MWKLMNDSALQNINKVRKMATISIATKFLMHILGLGAYSWSVINFLFISIDPFKAWVLLIVAIIYAIINIEHKIKTNSQKRREKEYDLIEREREKRRKDKEDQSKN